MQNETAVGFLGREDNEGALSPTGVISKPKVDMAKLLAADAVGVRLELIRGLPIWEASPCARHQKAVYRIQTSIRARSDDNSGCGCFHLADTYVRFRDGSLKRPDIAIFCEEPPNIDEAITMIPEAVIEIISPGYEVKDMEIAPYFYLAQGVKDVLIFDPRTLLVLHVRHDRTRRLESPVEIVLECGCQCTV